MNPLRILIVDDNKDTAIMLKMLLEIKGHTVDMAYTGCSALEHIKQFKPEVILLDIGLPCIDGWEIASRLRASGDQTTKIYALSGYGDPTDIQKSAAAGMNHHFTKPLDPNDLWEIMRSEGLR